MSSHRPKWTTWEDVPGNEKEEGTTKYKIDLMITTLCLSERPMTLAKLLETVGLSKSSGFYWVFGMQLHPNWIRAKGRLLWKPRKKKHISELPSKAVIEVVREITPSNPIYGGKKMPLPKYELSDVNQVLVDLFKFADFDESQLSALNHGGRLISLLKDLINSFISYERIYPTYEEDIQLVDKYSDEILRLRESLRKSQEARLKIQQEC